MAFAFCLKLTTSISHNIIGGDSKTTLLLSLAPARTDNHDLGLRRHCHRSIGNVGRERSFGFCNWLRCAALGSFPRGHASEGDDSRLLLLCPTLPLGRCDPFAGGGWELAPLRLASTGDEDLGLTSRLRCSRLCNQSSGKLKTRNFGVESDNHPFSIHA
jgi:hypothetical protein